MTLTVKLLPEGGLTEAIPAPVMLGVIAGGIFIVKLDGLALLTAAAPAVELMAICGTGMEAEDTAVPCVMVSVWLVALSTGAGMFTAKELVPVLFTVPIPVDTTLVGG